MKSLKNKFVAFGFYCIEVDGHDVSDLYNAFKNKLDNKPRVIIANTIKGKGVSFMEHQKDWHFNTLSKENYDLAMSEQPKIM